MHAVIWVLHPQHAGGGTHLQKEPFLTRGAWHGLPLPLQSPGPTFAWANKDDQKLSAQRLALGLPPM